jgi:hypothetical protein
MPGVVQPPIGVAGADQFAVELFAARRVDLLIVAVIFNLD